MCRKRAPQSKSIPRNHYDPTAGLAPDLSTWGTWTEPHGDGSHQTIRICAHCSLGVGNFIRRRLEAFLRKMKLAIKRTL